MTQSSGWLKALVFGLATALALALALAGTSDGRAQPPDAAGDAALDAAGDAARDAARAPIEELYRLELLPRLQPGVTTRSFSSYDRTGGNNDGFAGTYSKIRVENGASVLAEMQGAGCIQRIWFTHSEYTKPGLLNLNREHIRIYADGRPTAVLDVPLEDVFSGKLDGFPKPLVGEALGGYTCYVPIPYRNGCKVVVDGTGVRFYQINYRTYPSAEGRTTFAYPPSAAQRVATARAADVWRACGDPQSLGCRNTEQTVVAPPGDAKASGAVALPHGPRMIRAVWLVGENGATPVPCNVRLAITFDGAGKPAVELPLAFFFCQALDPAPFRSLVIGSTPKGAYNFLPMPYRREARLTLANRGSASDGAAAAGRGWKLVVVTEPLDGKQGGLGYLHAAYHESLPTTTGKYHPFAEVRGRGHYVGTYLVTDGVNEKKLPLWLEGDDRFTVDGQLRIHGTGSEDYFNCGWYAVPGRLNGPGGLPQHGFPVYRSKDGRQQAVAYRWHVTDPVHFDTEIRAEMEHGATNDVNANYRSVGFYYTAQP